MRSPGTGHTPEASAALGDRRELEAPLRINTEFALLRPMATPRRARSAVLLCASMRPSPTKFVSAV
jgi:hypothetical protein